MISPVAPRVSVAAQGRALLWLRWTLWQRRLSRERAWVRFLFNAVLTLGGGGLSFFFAYLLYGAAGELAQSPAQVSRAGGPLAIAAVALTLGFAARLYFTLLSLVRGSPFLDPRRFLLYAVPPWLITAINLGAQLLEPTWFVLYAPAVAVASGVALLPGAPPAWALLIGVVLLILAAATLFQLVLALAVEVAARPALRRAAWLVFVLLMSGFYLGVLRRPGGSGDNLEALISGRAWPWLENLPPGWAMKLADALGRGAPLEAALNLALLVSIALLALGAAHRLSLRDARRAPEEVQGGKVDRSRQPGWQLPLLSGAFSALFEKEAKTIFRAAWQQLVAAPLGFIVLRFAFRGGGVQPLGPQPLLFAAAYAHLGVLSFALNTFGFDVDGARALYLWPVRGRTVLAAKNAVAWSISLMLFLVLAALARATGPISAQQFVVGLLAHTATFPVLAVLGNACSVYFPAPLRGQRLRRAPGGGAIGARLLTLATLALAAWAPYALARLFGMPILAAYLGELLAMSVVYGGLLSLSEQLFESRREPLLKALAKDE